MTAPTLLRDWEGSDINGWLMSEKLDGWRMLWDGEKFISRQGNILDAPDWFKEGMPKIALDGELFLGRGMFNGIQGAMSNGWFGLEYRIFDVTSYNTSFEGRMNILGGIINLPNHAHVENHVVCKDIDHMMATAGHVLEWGGEGVVLRNPKALYKAGRTSDVLRWVPQDPVINRHRASLGSAKVK